MNTVSKMLVLLTFAFFTLVASAASALAEEDATRCPCWYMGYDDYDSSWGKGSCENPPPDSSKNECDLIGLMQEWEDGCLTAHEGDDGPKCPYKQ
jgi:hypothetical protein